MKKVLLFVALLSGGFVGASAQDQNYGGVHYQGVGFVANGFRTVAEENAVMEREMAERRKRELKENGDEWGQEKPMRQPAAAGPKTTVVKEKASDRNAVKKTALRVASR